MSNTQGFLDLTEQTSPPADAEPGVADAIAQTRALISPRPENVRFGSMTVNAGQSVLIVDADPSRHRVGVAVGALVTGTAVTTLAYLSDRVQDGGLVGGLRYIGAAQLPVLASGSDYLILQTTGALYVTVPASANAPVYVSYFTESYSAA